jgi:signal transduction histidine kinase
VVEKHKVLQILVNLVRNAKHACNESGRPDKRLTARAGLRGNDRAVISIVDNGIGISAENLPRIFSHGFTTRRYGHGFGLHNSALSAQELGGSLTARSAGAGQGAEFTLELPMQPPQVTLGQPGAGININFRPPNSTVMLFDPDKAGRPTNGCGKLNKDQ